MYYKHDLDYKYPEKCDEHMLVVNRVRETNFDENYDYIDKRASRKVKNFLFGAAMNVIVFPLLHITHRLKIHGKKNYKKISTFSKTVL